MPGGRALGEPSSPHSAPGHPTLAWSREAALLLHRQGACGGRVSAGKRTRDPRLRPEIQTRVRTSPRPARLRTWSILCGMRTVAGSQDTGSTAALLENVPTKALLPNPRQPSTQPRAGYRGTGVVHSPGPLWVLKSLPRNPRPARVSAGFQGLSVDAVLRHQDPPFRGCIAHQSRSDRLIFTALSWIKGSAPPAPCAYSPGGPSGGTGRGRAPSGVLHFFCFDAAKTLAWGGLEFRLLGFEAESVTVMRGDRPPRADANEQEGTEAEEVGMGAKASSSW